MFFLNAFLGPNVAENFLDPYQNGQSAHTCNHHFLGNACFDKCSPASLERMFSQKAFLCPYSNVAETSPGHSRIRIIC